MKYASYLQWCINGFLPSFDFLSSFHTLLIDIKSEMDKGLIIILTSFIFFASFWYSLHKMCAEGEIKSGLRENLNTKLIINKDTHEIHNFFSFACSKKLLQKWVQRNWVFATNSNLLIPISLQSDDANLWYF